MRTALNWVGDWCVLIWAVPMLWTLPDCRLTAETPLACFHLALMTLTPRAQRRIRLQPAFGPPFSPLQIRSPVRDCCALGCMHTPFDGRCSCVLTDESTSLQFCFVDVQSIRNNAQSWSNNMFQNTDCTYYVCRRRCCCRCRCRCMMCNDFLGRTPGRRLSSRLLQ